MLGAEGLKLLPGRRSRALSPPSAALHPTRQARELWVMTHFPHTFSHCAWRRELSDGHKSYLLKKVFRTFNTKNR